MTPEEKTALIETFKFKRDINAPEQWHAGRTVHLMFTDDFWNDVTAEAMVCLLQELAQEDALSWQTKIKAFTERVSH